MMAHTWRFFRSGGFDQVVIDSVEDLEALDSLDKKLWVALACPTKGLEFDERTLAYIDIDGDARIRVPELLNAVRWSLNHLKNKEVLLTGNDLPLSAINDGTEEGQKILASAKELLLRIGKAEADSISIVDTKDLSLMFPPMHANGDGLIPAAFAPNDSLANAINDIIATVGSVTDRSGDPAVSTEHIEQFFADLVAVQAWQTQLTSDSALLPLASATADAASALAAVEAKIDDYFVRAQLSGFDERAVLAMNGSDAQFIALGTQLLSVDHTDTQSLPLAKVTSNQQLSLLAGINPAWQAKIQAFVQQTVVPLLGAIDNLTLAQWQGIKSTFSAYRTWVAAKPVGAVAGLSDERLLALQSPNLHTELLTLVAKDLSVADKANALVDVDKLVRYQANLLTLINNFVSLSHFYTRKDKAIFQAGTLFIDERSCDLTIHVNDMAKHSSMAGLSNTYLLYCECSRKDQVNKMTIVAAVTAGDAGNLMVGRNGVFYDRAGRDWDATVVKIIENAISVREAFWTPYRRIGRMVSNQMQKMAADRDKAIESKSAESVTAGTSNIQAAANAPKDAPKTPPAPFDVAKFAGIFAAIGLAVGAIGTVIASIVSGFLGLEPWKMPIAILGIMLLISAPSMIMAWFKLRQRQLSPILDANGWAVNSHAKINIPFGTTLTLLATLPKGAKRSMSDPFA
ncbi:MAG: hypothetical protein Q7S87_05480 [Agitococcus sp.]|nr:hypothetical protein [Agitococcus sp.]